MQHSYIRRLVTSIGRPLLALTVAFFIGAVLIAVIQHDVAAPFAAYAALFRGAFGSPIGFANALRLTTPLLLTGAAILVALAAGRFNIGAEGQLTVGALAAAVIGAMAKGLPAPLALLLAMAAGMAIGAAWAFLPAYLREKRGAHEVITALLLNYVAQNVTRYLASTVLKDPTGQAPATAEINAFLPRLLPAYDVHAGLVVAVVVVITVLFALYKSVWGYETRMVGQGLDAASIAGIASTTVRIRAFLLSGALAGLAGAVTVLGEVPFRRFPADFYGVGYGFEGLAVALLVAGGAFPGSLRGASFLLPSALLFGALSAGAEAMAFDTSTPKQIITVVQAILLIAIAVRRGNPGANK